MDSPRRALLAELGSAAVGAALGAAGALLVRRSPRATPPLDSSQADALAASLMHDHIIASASHDLKTPLASIRLLAHLIKRDAERGSVESRQVVDRIELIETNVAKMSSLIAELLDVARLHRGQPILLQMSHTDLVPLANRVSEAAELGAGSHRIVVTSTEPALVGTWDADRLERVLTNLVANAVKYSPDGSEVVMRLSRHHRAAGDQADIEIADRGAGIPARDLPRVFEWFHRGSNVGNKPGTGVGLPSARLIVEQHGGTIDVHSRLGRGTTVRIRLPLHAERATREDVQPERGFRLEAVEQSSADRR